MDAPGAVKEKSQEKMLHQYYGGRSPTSDQGRGRSGFSLEDENLHLQDMLSQAQNERDMEQRQYTTALQKKNVCACCCSYPALSRQFPSPQCSRSHGCEVCRTETLGSYGSARPVVCFSGVSILGRKLHSAYSSPKTFFLLACRGPRQQSFFASPFAHS